jgi:threonine synthase
VALQLVGRLFDAELQRRGERATIVVATSGDTGSAAIAACAGRSTLDVVVLHPAGRVSDVQRRQMTTVDAPNVVNVAVEGTFDDCQDLVKALFADPGTRERLRLSAMNSINWARIAAQIPYYVARHAALGPCRVAVPSGNFGNILAGWIARRSGAPLEQLIIGSNQNDGAGPLGADRRAGRRAGRAHAQPQHGHPGVVQPRAAAVRAAGAGRRRHRRLMGRFRGVGSVEAPHDPTMVGASLDDDATLDEIADLYHRTGYLADPHTAVGIGAARACGRPTTTGTARWSAWPPPTRRSSRMRSSRPPVSVPRCPRTGRSPRAAERYDVLAADLEAVRAYVESRVAH